MANREITCIKKNLQSNDCKCITHVGNYSDFGVITTQIAVNDINSGIHSYNVQGQPVHVYDEGFLRTNANGDESDNLLTLPTCQ